MNTSAAAERRDTIIRRRGQAPIIEMGDGFMALLDPITHGKMNDCDIRIEKNIMEQDHKKKKAADRLRAKLAKKQEEKQAQADREYTEWLNRHRVVLAEQRRGRDEQRRLIAERQ